MNYMQQYAYLRHDIDQKLDAMCTVVVHCFTLAWYAAPTWQTLDAVTWSGPTEGSGVTLRINGRTMEFIHANASGETVYTHQVAITDQDALCTEATKVVEHMQALVGTNPAT